MNDPDLVRLVRQQQTAQAQTLAVANAGQARQDQGASAFRAELVAMQQRIQALQIQQGQWQQAQRREG